MKRKVLFVIFSFFLCIKFVSCLVKAPVDVTSMGISDLLDAMDKGYLTSEALVNIYLDRINTYDSMFNSISVLNENAIREAQELDKMRMEGNLKGKLHGIPILVKSNIDVKGLPTNAGTSALMQNYPKENATVVQRLIDEGAIILGSCNMSALAFSASHSYGSFGHVKNVFDVSKTPFGSSGGSAVAVGASFAAAALGTDTNSSVRVPSSGAGDVGMRPTYGLVSHFGVLPYDFERDTVGVITKNVSDNALLLSIIGGTDSRDVTTNNASLGNFDLSKATLEGVSIGVLTQYVTGSSRESGVTGLTDSDISKMLDSSIKALEDAGAKIVYLNNFVKYSNLKIAANTMAGGTMCDYFNDYIKGTEGPIKNFNDLARSKGKVWDLSGYAESCGVKVKYKSERDNSKKEYADYTLKNFNDYGIDVMLYPTMKYKAPIESQTATAFPGSSFGSVIGFPSITVPMGKASDGISYGIEFLAKPYEEDKLYNISYMYEKVNHNKVSSSPLVPALYETPDSVIKLMELYERGINDKDIIDWNDQVREFFKNYSSYENVSDEAWELISSHRDNKKTLFEEETFNKINKEVYWILVAIVGICFIIIVKNIIK